MRIPSSQDEKYDGDIPHGSAIPEEVIKSHFEQRLVKKGQPAAQ